MSYDQTLLYSGSSKVKTVTLSEPLSAFERFAICVSPDVIWESEVSANCNFHRFDRYGSWDKEGYLIWLTNYVVSNDCKTVDVNQFQILCQIGTSAQLRTLGLTNSANNRNCIVGIWGINRKDHVEEEGLGSPGEGWQEYNETPLWSGTDRPEHIHLSEKAIAFERLKVSVGSHTESINTYDVDAPTKYDTWLPLYSYWGTSLASYHLSMHRYKFLGQTDELSAVSGKTWQLGSGAANPYSASGSYASTENYVRKPLLGIWGINKKPVRTVNIIDGDHGSASPSMSSGYEGEPVILTSTPDEGWYLSGYNISGATLSGDQFTIEDEDVTVQPLFTDQEKRTITIVQPTGGTISASVLEGFDGTVVTLSNTPSTGYQFESYSVTGATLSGNSFMIDGSDVTVTGTFKDVSLTIDLNNVGKEVTTEFRNQTKYPNNWTDYRVFTCGKGPNGDYTNYIKNLGNLSSNFTLLWLPDTHQGTGYSYGRGNYTTDNTQAFYNTCPYGSGLDSSYPRYQRSRYYSTTINVSKNGNLKMFLHATSWWYTNILYFAIPKNLVRSVINSA